eukprot:6200231-Pleurochrysis_carterae.AAC.1
MMRNDAQYCCEYIAMPAAWHWSRWKTTGSVKAIKKYIVKRNKEVRTPRLPSLSMRLSLAITNVQSLAFVVNRTHVERSTNSRT